MTNFESELDNTKFPALSLNTRFSRSVFNNAEIPLISHVTFEFNDKFPEERIYSSLISFGAKAKYNPERGILSALMSLLTGRWTG